LTLNLEKCVQPLISFENIKKQFGNNLVLEGIILQINQGEIFGLLGLNGAGKTTLIRCLLGLLRVNSGSISLKGRGLRPKDVRENFGFLPENFSPPQNLKAGEFLRILGRGLGARTREVDRLLELAGLKEHSRKYIKTYSRGMIQRLGLAVCLLKDPQVLILDEPALGLDILGQRQVLELIGGLNQQGKTIFFTSHILSQIEKTCARIGIIHRGKIRFSGPAEELTRKHSVPGLEEAFLREIGI
jgi:ABC-2 type transport system ATP-binding protein